MSNQGGKISKRQQRKEERRQYHRRGRAEKKSAQDGIKDSLPFDLPNQPRVHLLKSKYGPKSDRFVKEGDRLEVEGRQLEAVPRSAAITHAGILNPNFAEGTLTPRFAAIRFTDGVSADLAVKLEQCVADCKSAGMKSSKTAAHGTSFQQTWLGYWRKYEKVAFLAASSRPTKPALDDAIQSMMRTLDAAFAIISQRIRALDPDAYARMRFSHRPIIKAALNDVGQLRHADAHKKWYGKHPERATTSSARIGGLGSMLAVSTSTGGGTTFHYDQGDAGHVYSAILVLKTGGALHLPETGYKLDVRPGDVVFFLANQQLHKLDVDLQITGAEQLVFTLWTDKNAAESSAPGNIKDFYTVLPGSEDYEEYDEDDE